MDASVILLTRAPGPEFIELLEALGRQADPPRELLVVDSGSPPDTLERAERAGARIEHVEPSSFGHGRTRNHAASLARGEVLVFLTQDAVPVGRDFLERLTAPLRDQRVAGVAARQLAAPGAAPLFQRFLEAAYPDRPRRIEGPELPAFGSQTVWFSNVASAVRRRTWQELPFRDVLMSEDQYWAHDAARAGHALVYEPAAQVVHHQKTDCLTLVRRNFDSAASLRGLPLEGPSVAGRRELAFLAGLALELGRSRRFSALGGALAMELARLAGFGLGSASGILPRALCRRLSQLPWRW